MLTLELPEGESLYDVEVSILWVERGESVVKKAVEVAVDVTAAEEKAVARYKPFFTDPSLWTITAKATKKG